MSILVIVAAVIFIAIVMIGLISPSEKKLGNIETEKAELDAKGAGDYITEPVYDSYSLGDALSKAWAVFSDVKTADIVELSHDWVKSQLSMDNYGKKPEIIVTYVFNENGNVKIPQYVLDREEGNTGLYHIRYSFPEDKEVIERHLCEIMGISSDSIIDYCLWTA